MLSDFVDFLFLTAVFVGLPMSVFKFFYWDGKQAWTQSRWAWWIGAVLSPGAHMVYSSARAKGLREFGSIQYCCRTKYMKVSPWIVEFLRGDPNGGDATFYVLINSLLWPLHVLAAVMSAMHAYYGLLDNPDYGLPCELRRWTA